jgi:hypothetical protein
VTCSNAIRSLLISTLAVACTASSEGRAGDTPDGGGQADAVVDGDARRKIAAFRQQLLDRIASSDCATGACEVLTPSVVPAEPSAASQGQRILLIDDAITAAAATRYLSRTLAFIAVNDRGVYAEIDPQFSIARDAYDILRAIDEFPLRLRAEDLEIAQQFYDVFGDDGLPEEEHGTGIVSFLAEKIPDAQFVVSEDQLTPPIPCSVLGEDAATEAGWERLTAFVENAAASLGEIVVAHNINAIHLSWGLTHENLSDGFERECGRAAPRSVTERIMRLYVDLFRRFTRLETAGSDGRMQPVVVFQAGTGTLANDPAPYLLDCAEIERRLRVYSVGYAETSVPCEGAYDRSLLSPPGWERLACNDVFMVMGYTSIFKPPRAGAFFAYMPYGIGFAPRPAWPVAPSFANPVALAYYFFIAQRDPDAGPDAWLRTLTQDGTKPILDPLLYDAFPRATNEPLPPACTMARKPRPAAHKLPTPWVRARWRRPGTRR